MDQAADLDELRRLAYSRSGTDDDRRRLAQLESSIQVVTESPSPVPLPSMQAADGAPQDDSAVEDAPIVRSRWLPALLGAAGGALLATAATLTFVALSVPEPEPQTMEATSLVVFDREPRAVDDPASLRVDLEYLVAIGDGSPADPDDLTLRWVGMAAGNDVYVVRWNRDEDDTICLLVVSADETVSGCATESEFIASGLRIGAAGVDVKWGPTGTEVWVSSFR